MNRPASADTTTPTTTNPIRHMLLGSSRIRTERSGARPVDLSGGSSSARMTTSGFGLDALARRAVSRHLTGRMPTFAADPAAAPASDAEHLKILVSTIELVSPAGAGPTWSRSLTTRELVVLGARSEEVTPQGIASELFVPRTTVTSRVRSLYRKLGVSDRTGVISWAQAAGRRRPSISSRRSGCLDAARVGAVRLAPLGERTDRILARLLGCSPGRPGRSRRRDRGRTSRGEARRHRERA